MDGRKGLGLLLVLQVLDLGLGLAGEFGGVLLGFGIHVLGLVGGLVIDLSLASSLTPSYTFFTPSSTFSPALPA